ncbi:unnamed protein product [Prorocentrum cordatum]|uniref:Calmodulin n=1 Tax=Prorocentrum cordatum TaxID=2364126 RepID=A0ABN9PXM6_9DINO|nr:unnamed protein product [Polarella glacialis]
MPAAPAQGPQPRGRLPSPRGRPDGVGPLGEGGGGGAELPGAAPLSAGSSPQSGDEGLRRDERRSRTEQYHFVDDDAPGKGISGRTLSDPAQDQPVVRALSCQSSWTGYSSSSGARWQREHNNEWRPYSDGVHSKIEAAFLAGESKVRLKLQRPKGDELKENHPYPMVEVFFEDMVQYDPWNNCRHRVRRVGPAGLLFHARWALGRLRHLADTGRWRLETQGEYEERRDRVASGVLALLEKKEEDVHTFWVRHHARRLSGSRSCRSFSSGSLSMENGWARVAGAPWFFMLSMLFVVLNAVWIWVETDMNDGASFIQAEFRVQVVEVAFCAYFSIEWFIRWKSYDLTAQALSDRWFLFDAILVFFMIIEIVVVPASVAIAHSDTSNAGGTDIGVFRTLRLLRLSRVARLLRVIPELMMLIRGIKASLRTVSFTVILLSGLLFIFAVFFKTQVRDHPLEEEKFSTVFNSMLTLLMYGTLLDSPMEFYLEITDEWPELVIAYLVFICLSSFTLLNMLIGMLCDVVQKVADQDQSDIEVRFLTDNLLNILQDFDTSGDRHISRDEFNVLMHSPDTHDVLTKFGTDPESFILLADQIYECDADGLLSFKEFFDTVMRLRGGNSARVKDMVELRLFVGKQFEALGKQVGEMSNRESKKGIGPGHPSNRPAGSRGGRKAAGRRGALEESDGASAESWSSASRSSCSEAGEARAALHRSWRLLSRTRNADPRKDEARFSELRRSADQRSEVRRFTLPSPRSGPSAAAPFDDGTARRLDELLAGVRALQEGQRALQQGQRALQEGQEALQPRTARWPTMPTLPRAGRAARRQRQPTAARRQPPRQRTPRRCSTPCARMAGAAGDPLLSPSARSAAALCAPGVASSCRQELQPQLGRSPRAAAAPPPQRRTPRCPSMSPARAAYVADDLLLAARPDFRGRRAV